MNNVMVDIETLGQNSNAPVVSIGAVIFDPLTGELGSEFECIIKLTDAMKYGNADASTIQWWLAQSDEARAVFNDKSAIGLKDALIEFHDFLADSITGGYRKRIIWGNGATFDPVILDNAYQKTSLPTPWAFYNVRDVRTIVDLGRNLFDFDPKKDLPFDGVQHNALADAKHQAMYVSAIFKLISSAACVLGDIA